jgi:hypothetical protein
MSIDMDRITKLIVIISRNLSKALESIAFELEPPLSQAENSNLATLNKLKSDFVALEIGVFVLFEDKNGNRYGGTIRKIDGDNLEIENTVLGKTWTISRLQVYYSRLDDHD